MSRIRIPAAWMRGGTSKGLFLLAADLPDEPAARDALLLRAIGSPDPYGKQIDGLGGATSSTSKVVIVAPSARPDCDVDYLFGQVPVGGTAIDWSGNCGNLSAAVGPFAIERGLVACPRDGSATVRIWQANIGKRILAHVPVRGGAVCEEGDFLLDGVAFAAALAGRGARVALVDADAQKSAMRWLRQRPVGVPVIAGLDWSSKGDVGEVPRGFDWLVIDAPGALRGGRAEALIAEAGTVIAPVLPSYFDADSTRRFLRDIEAIKRIRKGKVGLHVLANRVHPNQRATLRLRDFFAGLGQEPIAWISDRAAYGELAEQGLAIFDRHQRAFAPMQAQWIPVLSALD